MRQLKIIYLIILLCSSLDAYADNNIEVFKTPKGYHSKCLQIKSELLDDTKLFKTFQKYPQTNTPTDSYPFDWHNMRIYLPKYQIDGVYVGTMSQDDIIFVYKNRTMVLIYSDKDQPMGDVFAMSDLEGGLYITDMGKYMTKKMFGKSPRLSDLNIYGYEHTPEDIKCTNDNFWQDVALNTVFALKSVGHGLGDVENVYRENKDTNIYIVKLHKAEENKTSYTITQPIDGNETTYVDYVFPKGFQNRDLVFAFDDKNITTVTKLPKWLESLQTAINTNSRANWDKYIEVAKQSGISEKSIERTKIYKDL
ncbi:hypothetical protein [Francisella philomiragia]|uniref:hypothetical protein n=1 Tax=Francisella philomiragia TaxID=28110 RepID=UPI001908DC41|nr:hypothetical protein [Francisella philomiragia]MBK2268305.1 hypothetical protein [Francisella philomiragia]MBK2279700.1 hypothetical protein [Francisella philomiragia]MBK2287616.1 hypothetical protein [Francisella philomiragia]MBK2289595.1 hypothetical protein [Francisella philomiragia]MBK2291493.1 hypothetical protein [Francisella philomiragia]